VKAVVDTNILVSGLLWLLTLKSFAGIPIIDAAEAVNQLGLS